MTPDRPSMPSEFTRDVHEHERLLSFNNDCDCYVFGIWWEKKGWEAFRKWAEKNGDKHYL